MIPTDFSMVYDNFLSKITEDMYLELTEEETKALLLELLLSAIPKFEFPRKSLNYEYCIIYLQDGEEIHRTIWNKFEGIQEYDITQDESLQDKEIKFIGWTFVDNLNLEEIDILAIYMVVEWLGQQLASVENTRMKYSGSDFKFTSQANHMQKLLQLQKDYERKGFHLQRLYKRRIKDTNGIYRSTLHQIMEPVQDYTVEESGQS